MNRSILRAAGVRRNAPDTSIARDVSSGSKVSTVSSGRATSSAHAASWARAASSTTVARFAIAASFALVALAPLWDRSPLAGDLLEDRFTASWSVESDQVLSGFGLAVCVAGDVNGDGFSDLAVGAPNFDNGQVDEGMVFVYFGSASGLSTTPDWTAEGNQASANLGSSVSAAGDVNGDGFDDLLIGAKGYAKGENDEGIAIVFLGGPAGLGANGTPHNTDWLGESNVAGALFGDAVSFAGDVNGDGFHDIVVGAPFYANGQAAEGAVYVYRGSSEGLGTTPARILESNQSGARFGDAVAGGDVTADGFSDIVAGAPLWNGDFADEGAIFLYLGGAGGIAPSPAVVLEDADEDAAHFGESVAYAGDIGGDGYGEVLVGIPNAGTNDQGEARIYVGGPDGVESDVYQFTFSGDPNAHTGASVATAGDFTGDGFADVLIGWPGQPEGSLVPGGAWLYEGVSGGGISLDVSPALTGQQDGELCGMAVTSAGDVNGDGFTDLAIGAPGWDNGQVNEGRVLVVLGRAQAVGVGAERAGGGTDGEQFGVALSYAGDVNADGFTDAIIGAAGYDFGGQIDEGRAILVLGSEQGLEAPPSWTFEPNVPGARFGTSCDGAGDVNGDGYDDVVIGSPGDLAEDDPLATQVWLFAGSASGLGSTPAWTSGGFPQSSSYGGSVAGAGDVNGDGYGDLLVGAPGLTGEPGEGAGAAFLYLGGPSGLRSEPYWVREGDASTDRLGFAVCGAGDLNGDGYSDVAIGAPGESAHAGRVEIYYGLSGRFSATADVTLTGHHPGGLFGFDVASAGDVNGDGFADLLVSEPVTNGSELARVALYLGSAGGLVPEPAWVELDEDATNGFGMSISSAGDVNLDGFTDLMIGNPLATDDDARDHRGRAWLYLGSPGGPASAPEQSFRAFEIGVTQFGLAVDGGGDLDGDGLPDVLIGAPAEDGDGSDRGMVYLRTSHSGGGISRFHRMLKVVDSSTPIAALGISDFDTAFRVVARLRSVYGRARTGLLVEPKLQGVPFDGSDLRIGNVLLNGLVTNGGSYRDAGLVIDNLPAGQPIHFRVRVIANWPFAPHTPWFTLPHNGPTEWDVRTRGFAADVPGGADGLGAPGAARLWLAPIAPNPVVDEAEIRFRVGDGGAAPYLRLEVVDVAGRRVRSLSAAATGALANGAANANGSTIRWDGRDEHGARLAGGVYFVRLLVGDQSETRKLVLHRANR